MDFSVCTLNRLFIGYFLTSLWEVRYRVSFFISADHDSAFPMFSVLAPSEKSFAWGSSLAHHIASFLAAQYNTTKSETYPVLFIIIIFQDIFKCELRLDNHLGQSYNASVPPYTIAKLNQYLARFFHAVLRSLGARKNAPIRCIVAILQCIVFSKDIFEF